MAEARRKFDEDFKQGAVRLVGETGKPIAQVARELGINEGTLGNWCARERRRHGEGALSESCLNWLLRSAILASRTFQAGRIGDAVATSHRRRNR